MIAPSLCRDQYAIVGHVKDPSLPDEGASNAEMVDALNYACGTTSSVIMGVMTYSGHQTYINADKPVAAKIHWVDDGGNHAVVVSGYRTSDSSLQIIDPWYDCSTEWYGYMDLTDGTRIQSGDNGQYVNTWIVQ
jgi:hypothetical protein